MEKSQKGNTREEDLSEFFLCRVFSLSAFVEGVRSEHRSKHLRMAAQGKSTQALSTPQVSPNLSVRTNIPTVQVEIEQQCFLPPLSLLSKERQPPFEGSGARGQQSCTQLQHQAQLAAILNLMIMLRRWGTFKGELIK